MGEQPELKNEKCKLKNANSAEERELSADERGVLEALWSGKTQREAAELVGVSRRTVQYWVKRPAFREEWEARRVAQWRELQESLRPKPAEPHPLEKRVTGLGWRWGERIHAANTIVAEAVRIATREQRREMKQLLREVREEVGRLKSSSGRKGGLWRRRSRT